MFFAGRKVHIEKNCARGLEYGAVVKTSGTVFPNTDLGRQITCLCFPLWKITF